MKINVTEGFIVTTLDKVTRVLRNPVKELQKDLLRKVADNFEVLAKAPKAASTNCVPYNQQFWFSADAEDGNLCNSFACIAGEICLAEVFTLLELAIIGNNWFSIVPRELIFFIQEEALKRGFAMDIACPTYYNDDSLICLLAVAISGVSEDFVEKILINGTCVMWPDELADIYDDEPERAAARLLRGVADGLYFKE